MAGFGQGVKEFFLGSPDIRNNVSTLRKEQEPGYQQLQNAAQGRGAGGAFGESSDYYRDLLSNDSQDYNNFAAPALRQYQEDIVPGLSEQFAGMGAGGLSSSGFRNAQVQGATDLSERLGALRAQLRQSGAQGLQNIGQLGLGNYSQNMVTQQGQEGVLPKLIGQLPAAAAAYATGNPAALLANQNNGSGNMVGANTVPYGSGGPQASPQGSGKYGLPNFMNQRG